MTHLQAAPDIDVLTSTATVPGFGNLAINAFVLHGAEPVLVDTGAVVESDEFMAALRTVIDPADLRGSGSPTPTSTTSAPCTGCWPRTPSCG